MKARERLIMIGNGMAGAACLEEILRRDRERYEVTVFGAEKYGNYNRILLSSVLAGDASWDEIMLHPEGWYAQHSVNLRLGIPVIAIDRTRRVVRASDGSETPYDRIIMATGSEPFIPPIPGTDLEGVMAFRTIDDCRAMIEGAKSFTRAAVIGGGLLGLEAARGLANLGMEVTVVHLADRLMERQLDVRGAWYLKRAIEGHGIAVQLNRSTTALWGDGRVQGLRFKDGESLQADLVVIAAGIRPSAQLARASGLMCNRGIVVDDLLRTSDPAIHAVGECAEHRGQVYGLVAPLYEQGRVLAAEMTGQPTAPYEGSVVSTKLKVSGVDVFSAGVHEEDREAEVLLREDSSEGIYQKAIVKDGRLIGAVLVGDIAPAATVDRFLKSRETLNGARRTLLAVVADEAAGPADVMAMPDAAIICGCNGVSKGTILETIRAQKLMTRKEVAACCGASRSCGGCGPQVEALIAAVHGGAATGPAVKPLCDCTALSREQVVEAIREKHLLAVREVMNVLGWEGEGCAICRPAINYFLTMCWPGENEDDPRSRFINERVHANIQRDGTFSVVPRIYGGVTTPDELMRIAQVAQRFRVPTVKITGGQRIDLLGVKKEDLPAMWDELGLPSGFAYAKAVRTVKTCVGSDYCRFGTRDSMGLGIRIERMFENLWTPAKVKMAVNACPRNCAESLIKDVGLIGVEKAWEIYVGGNGGVKVRSAELLAAVETDDEALELIAAFLQLYREDANYNERTSVWCERVGIEWLRREVVEKPERRAELALRMQRALDGRVDPWMERARRAREGDPETLNEFTTLAAGSR